MYSYLQDTTLDSMYNLATAYHTADRLDEALPLLEEALILLRQSLPANRWLFGATAGLLVDCLLQKSQYHQAESRLRESLGIRQTAAPNDWQTFHNQTLLGTALLGQNRHAEAEELLVAGYQGLKQQETKIPGAHKIRILKSAGDRLVRLYESWERPDQAAEWRRKLGRPKSPEEP